MILYSNMITLSEKSLQVRRPLLVFLCSIGLDKKKEQEINEL